MFSRRGRQRRYLLQKINVFLVFNHVSTLNPHCFVDLNHEERASSRLAQIPSGRSRISQMRKNFNCEFYFNVFYPDYNDVYCQIRRFLFNEYKDQYRETVEDMFSKDFVVKVSSFFALIFSTFVSKRDKFSFKNKFATMNGRIFAENRIYIERIFSPTL